VKLKARVECSYENPETARAVARALKPDNLQSRMVKVKTTTSGGTITTTVEMEGKIETLLATLDDLLACTETAESVIE